MRTARIPTCLRQNSEHSTAFKKFHKAKRQNFKLYIASAMSFQPSAATNRRLDWSARMKPFQDQYSKLSSAASQYIKIQYRI